MGALPEVAMQHSKEQRSEAATRGLLLSNGEDRGVVLRRKVRFSWVGSQV